MNPPFSARLPWDRPENALAKLEREERRRSAAAGVEILDLTLSDPTRAGLPDLGPRLRVAFGEAASGLHEPSAAGLRQAREAVAADVAALGGTPVSPQQLVLTASSSESYGFLFKLLCDPGDAVLVPEPSYPLFEYLARLEGIEPVAYRLAYDGAWHVDFASVDDALARAGRRARAVVAVNPNNPTGAFLKRAELEPLARRCEARGLAVIADEVFAAYGAGEDAQRVRALAAEPDFTARVLTFALGGLSKSCALPQLKLGWIAVAGPPQVAAGALARLELVADTYLSVSGPVQRAAARLLALGREARAAITSRVAANRAHLARAVEKESPLTLLASEGGWSALLRVPATRSDEEWALELLREDGVLVQPGYFFEMTGGAYLVLSLLPPEPTFIEATRRLLARCALQHGQDG